MEKQRKAWISASLSGTVPGLGQLYNGNIRLAIILGALSVLFYSTIVLFCLDSFRGLLLAATLASIFSVYAAIEAWRASKKLGVMALGKFQKKRFYVLFLVAVTCSPEVLDLFTPPGDHFATFSIPSQSMVPTLLIGDYVMANGWAFARREPERGEVIVFQYPKDHDIRYVKRLIGLPGDVIEVRHNEIILNGTKIEDKPGEAIQGDDGYPYRLFEETIGNRHFTVRKINNQAFMDRENFGPITVPAGQYFAMGDNRDRSSDSRYWGFIQKSELVGKMLYLYFSFDKENLQMRWDRVGKEIQ